MRVIALRISMKTKLSLAVFFSLALLAQAPLLAATAPAGDLHEASPAPGTGTGKLVAVTEKDAAWAAQARKTYPLAVCVSSGEKLGSMGKAPEFIYKVAGQPDRLVVFCCGGCEENFMKDPAKHLAKIDEAAAAKAKK